MNAQDIRDVTAALLEAERLGIPMSRLLPAAEETSVVQALVAEIAALRQDLAQYRGGHRQLRIVREA